MEKSNPQIIIVAKPPRALEPKRPSLTKLSRELWAIIAELVQATSPRTINSLALVNSLFYCLANDSRHRLVDVNFTTDEDESVIRRCNWMESTGLLPAVRELTIVDRQADRRAPVNNYRTCWTTIARILPLMTGLKNVAYRGNAVPAEIFLALKALPHVGLETLINVLVKFDSVPAMPEDSLLLLRGNTNLHSLDVKILYLDPRECAEVMQPLKATILSFPNLRRLAMQVKRPLGVGLHLYKQYGGLGFEEGDKIPPLEELALLEYPFGREPRNDGQPPGFNSKGYSAKGDEVELWADQFDWSRLRRLQTPNGDFALKLMPKLTTLEVFEHKGSEFAGTLPFGNVARFVLHVPAALTTICVRTLNCVSLDGVLQHSNSLQKLHLHQNETYQRDWNNDAIDLVSLVRIQQTCHLISDLSLDIPRSGAWPYDILDVLASFQNLKRLKLWFELGISDSENPIKPYLTVSAAKHIFSYLRSHYPGDHSPLDQLELRVGECNDMGLGFPSPQAFWEKYNITSFICKLSERDDEAAADVFSVECPELAVERAIRSPPRPRTSRRTPRSRSRSRPGGRASQGLRKLRSGLGWYEQDRDERLPEFDENSEAARVARDGPVPMDKWDAHF